MPCAPAARRKGRTGGATQRDRDNKKSPQQAAGYWGSKAADRKHAASCGDCIPKAIQASPTVAEWPTQPTWQARPAADTEATMTDKPNFVLVPDDAPPPAPSAPV